MVLPEVQHWKLVESYGKHASVTNETAELPQTSIQVKEDCSPAKDAGLYGQRRAFLSWQESSGEQHSNDTRRSSTARRTGRSTSRRSRIGSTRSANASRRRARKLRRCWRVSEFGNSEQKKSRNSEQTCCGRASRWTRTGATY